MDARHVNLLRGINVGGRNKVPMAQLRAIYVELGCTDVATYLQSGNVVFRRQDPHQVAGEAERAVEAAVGVSVRVLDRTGEELITIAGHNPFPLAPDNRHLVAFLEHAPDPGLGAELAAIESGDDEVALIGRELHLHYPRLPDPTPLSKALLRMPHVAVATARNWRTVLALAALVAAPAP